MFVDCRYEGALTECCLESAAIDRIFYNLVNNACRHAASAFAFSYQITAVNSPASYGRRRPDCLR